MSVTGALKKNPSKKICNFKKNISCNIASVLLICIDIVYPTSVEKTLRMEVE